MRTAGHQELRQEQRTSHGTRTANSANRRFQLESPVHRSILGELHIEILSDLNGRIAGQPRCTKAAAYATMGAMIEGDCEMPGFRAEAMRRSNKMGRVSSGNLRHVSWNSIVASIPESVRSPESTRRRQVGDFLVDKTFRAAHLKISKLQFRSVSCSADRTENASASRRRRKPGRERTTNTPAASSTKWPQQ